MPDPDRGTTSQSDPGDTPGVAGLGAALAALRTEVAALDLPLETVTAPAARRERAHALGQLDDYLLPRLRSAEAPLLVVVGGSTGAGKSTLVNSVLGQHVTTPGALRPTTRSPVLVHHPLDAHWFVTDRIFPRLAREDGASSGAALRLVATDALPQGLALLDAPDLDSVVVGNRELAAQLLAAADLWLFVTTAARYADAVPWEMLKEGAARRAQIAILIDRVDPGAEVVRDHLKQMLVDHGLGEAPVFLVPESPLVDGMLPRPAVAPVSRWLTAVSGDDAARDAIITATRDGVIDDLAGRTMTLADAADAQRAADTHLRQLVGTAYERAARDVADATSDGSLLRGEVLSRWQDFVGTGDFMRGVEERIGILRDRITGFFRGRPAAAPRVSAAISTSLEAIIFDAADRAAERTYADWHRDPAGTALLGGLELSRASPDLRAELAGEIRAWQADVLALVGERGADKRGRARVLAVGVNGLGAALMVVVFAQTGGLTGAEVGIAGGSALLAQRLLEAVFGDEAVRALARAAEERLTGRVDGLLAGEAARFTLRLDAVGSGRATGVALRGAAQDVQATAGAERAARAIRPVTQATHVTLEASPYAADSDPVRTGRLRGAELEVVDDPYREPVPARTGRGGFLGRILHRSPRAEQA